jgi:hypothetical protein
MAFHMKALANLNGDDPRVELKKALEKRDLLLEPSLRQKDSLGLSAVRELSGH